VPLEGGRKHKGGEIGSPRLYRRWSFYQRSGGSQSRICRARRRTPDVEGADLVIGLAIALLLIARERHGPRVEFPQRRRQFAHLIGLFVASVCLALSVFLGA
jgi:hypothetical protein